VYRLPSFEIKPPTPTKFVRDNLNIKDIPGSSPRVRNLPHLSGRNMLDVSDIAGASAVPRTKNRSTTYDSFHYKDVTGPEGYQVKQRTTDP
jgi:hypothetical protein